MKHNPVYWTQKMCQQCGEEFWVYKSKVRKGEGKFCSISCATTYRNIHNNPTKDKKVREKISKNHADVNGEKNPMYGVRLTGNKNHQYIDGRSKYSAYYRFVAFENLEHKCNECGKIGKPEDFDVHHKDMNRDNNSLSNLEILCPKCHLTVRHKYKRDSEGKFTEVVANAC